MIGKFSRRQGGFALVITLALLALLVLAVLALSTLVRVNGQISTASTFQTQARQNALLGLNVALANLQTNAGPDSVLTGTGGVAGAPISTRTRQWCGVWPANGLGLPVWLASGALPQAFPAINPARTVLRLVGSGSTGTEGVDKEFVEVGLEPILVPDELTGAFRAMGNYGFWVGDEGVKASAVILNTEVQSSPTGGTLRPNFRRLLSATFSPASNTNGKAIAFEQLGLTATSVSLLNSFHQLTRSSLALQSTASQGNPRLGNYVVGAFNVNTTSEAAWRSWLEYPDSSSSTWGLSADRTLSAARGIRDRIAARARPFSSLAELEASGIIQQAFDNSSPRVTTVTQAQFLLALDPILTARSDTFRIRAYGDALNLVTNLNEATAYCEAIVQRTPELAPGALGRRFVITYFRWLGPNDI